MSKRFYLCAELKPLEGQLCEVVLLSGAVMAGRWNGYNFVPPLGKGLIGGTAAVAAEDCAYCWRVIEVKRRFPKDCV